MPTMNRIAASFVSLAGFASSAWAAEQPKTDVRVVNTPAESVPVAVQGTTGVNLMQIDPNVVVPVQTGVVQVTGAVEVSNPVAIKPPTPFQTGGFEQSPSGDPNLWIILAIPDGTCLRIDQIFAEATTPAGSDQHVSVKMNTYFVNPGLPNGDYVTAFLRGEKWSDASGDHYQVGQQLTMYADSLPWHAPNDIEILFHRDGVVGGWTGTATVVGVLIECPQ